MSQVDFVRIINVPCRSVVSFRAAILSRHLINYGCLAARDEHLVAYFHIFYQKNNVPIDACSNIIYSGQCNLIKDLFHELITNIDKTYHVVDSFNSKVLL